MLSADMDNNLSSSSLETISCPLLPFFQGLIIANGKSTVKKLFSPISTIEG